MSDPRDIFDQIRKEYRVDDLAEDALPEQPLPLFEDWFAMAVTAGLAEPNGMTLATSTPDGRPSARIVLLKGYDERGFVFYSNYDSRKGRELAANPYGALVFWWIELERQVRLEGEISRLPDSESDAYYASRPPGSQRGAWASPQSEVISGRAELEERLARLQAEAPANRPPHWGGYRLDPHVIEFWQGRPNRLHDRIRYRKQADGSWLHERLAP